VSARSWGTLAAVAAAALTASSAPARADVAATVEQPLPAAVARAGGATARAYRALAQAFPELAAPAPNGTPAAGGDRVTGYAADNVARVAGPGGTRIVVSSRPLRTTSASGASRPVDLTLTSTAGGSLRTPSNAPFSLRLATAVAAGFTIGPDAAHAVHVTPLATDPTVSAVDVGNQLLAAGTQTGVDTLLRPTTTGLATFAQITDPAAPERYGYQLDLAPGQTIDARDGVVTVGEGGATILTIAVPVAVDASGASVPIDLTASGDTITMTVRHRSPSTTYPVLADPEWYSSYDWSTQAGIGTEGWYVASITDPAFYATDILTEPIGTPRRDGVGIRITPKGGQTYPENVAGEVAWTAPGTTTILSADFKDVIERDDSDRQTSRLQLAGGSGPLPTHDYFAAGPVADVLDDVPLLSPNGDATSAIVELFTPPCTAEELATSPPSCPRQVKSGSQSQLRVGSVDLSLTDDDDPTARASGPLRDLADRWTQGTTPLDVDLDFGDPGSGVDSWSLTSTDAAGDHAIDMSGPLCDAAHLTPGQSGQICPFTSGAHGVSIDVAGLPEGQNRFTAAATDFAGNASGDGSDVWSVYVDRGPPSLTATGPLVDAERSWVDPGQLTPTVRLAAHDDRSGVERTDLTATDEAGATVLTSTSDACAAPGPIGQPCPNDYADDIALNANALPEGTLSFSASAVDHVGLKSAPATWTLQLDRTPPIARAAGDLVALQDQWTNRAGPVSVTLDGRDALSGVSELELVAVNDDGRHTIASASTCDSPADDGSCPHLTSTTVDLDAGALPDGLNHFEVQARDRAGHVSRTGDTWDAYIDHTPPPEPTGAVVTSNSPDSLSIAWNPVVDVPEGAAGVSYEYLVLDHGTPVTQWTSTPRPSAIIPGLSPGVEYEIRLCASDLAKNQSKCAVPSGRTANGPTAHTALKPPTAEQIRVAIGLDALGGSVAAAARNAALKGLEAGALRTVLRDVADFASKANVITLIVTTATDVLAGDGNPDCEQGPLYMRAKPTFKNAGTALKAAAGAKVGAVAATRRTLASALSAVDKLTAFTVANKAVKGCRGPNTVATMVIAKLRPALVAAQLHVHELDVDPADVKRFLDQNQTDFNNKSNGLRLQSLVEARIAFRSCLDTATRAQCFTLKVFLPGSDIQGTTDNDRNAIFELNSRPRHPAILHWAPKPDRTAKRQWYYNDPHKENKANPCEHLQDLSCDEYPFNSTIEGGPQPGRPFPSLASVPLAENKLQGTRLQQFYLACQLTSPDRNDARFVVAPLPNRADGHAILSTRIACNREHGAT